MVCLAMTREMESNSLLIDSMWPFYRAWCAREFHYPDLRPCPVHIVSRDRMRGENTAGLFYYQPGPKLWNREIYICDEYLCSTQQLLVVLTHEVMHYVHSCLVRPDDFICCPKVFKEGFAEHATRYFFRHAGYDIPPRAFDAFYNQHYQLGRWMVEVICQEGYGIRGFVLTFLSHLPRTNAWARMDVHFLVRLAMLR